MNIHFENSLGDLKRELLTMGGMVEDAIHNAIHALTSRNREDALQVIRRDDLVDSLEVKIEEEALKILALYHPVAEDLRFVTSVMKINNDIERIGDLAVNTARRAKNMAELKAVDVPPQFQAMSQEVIEMLRNGLKAFLERDSYLARKVIQADDSIDKLHREALTLITSRMQQNPDQIESLTQLLWCSRNLERMADHITNLCEDVVYMVEGEIVRHQDNDPPTPPATNNVVKLPNNK